MNRKKIIIIVLVVLVVLGIAAKLIFFREKFLYAGTLEVTKVDMPARVQAVVEERVVDEGDRVKINDLLLKFACEDIILARSLAVEDFERAEKLFKSGSVPKETFDQIKNKKEDLDLKFSWCEVRSPLDGVVLNKYHEKGEMVSPGARLFTLANIKDIFAFVYVPQELVAKLKLGQKLTGYLPELDMKEFPGKIVMISSEAEFTPKNVQTREERTRLVYGIKISFLNEEEILKPGMTIEVKID